VDSDTRWRVNYARDRESWNRQRSSHDCGLETLRKDDKVRAAETEESQAEQGSGR
jgi:hypothetical protein